MKKSFFLILLLCMLCMLTLPALAQEQSLPVVRITCAAEAVLSREAPVAAQVTLVRGDEETVFDAQLRLHDKTQDLVEGILPQQSLRIDGENTRFILYNDGNDALYTKVMSAACCDLMAQGPLDVPVRAQEPVEVYLNGAYWGLYTLRDVIEDAVARFEGLDDAAALNVADANQRTVCGDVSGLQEAFRRIEALDLSREEDRQTLGELLDTDSFLNWMAVNAFVGTGNIYGEVFFYQAEDGSWKCAAGDFSFAFFAAQDNSIGRLVNHDELPVARLAGRMLREPAYREAFLLKIGALYQALPTPVMQAAVDKENARIASVLPAHMERWAEEFSAALKDQADYPPANAQEAQLFQRYRVYRLRDKTLVRRPWYLYDSVQTELNVSGEDMLRYFGEAKPELPEVPGDTWEDYKAANQ